MRWLQQLRFRFQRWRWNQEAEALLADMDHHRRAQIHHAEALRAAWGRWRAVQKQLDPDNPILTHFASPEQAARLARKLVHFPRRRNPDSAA